MCLGCIMHNRVEIAKGEAETPAVIMEPQMKRTEPLRKYSAALLDVDGVLVDSEPLHYEENRKFFEKYGARITPQMHIDYWIAGKARGSKGIIEDFGLAEKGVTHEAAREEKQKSYINEFLPKLKRMPGALELVEYLALNRVPAVAVSSGYRGSVIASLEITGIRKYMAHVIGQEDVKNPKPHPESWLKGAEAIKKPIKDCVVVEDSPRGIVAANRAGAGWIIACPNEWTRFLDFTGEAKPNRFIKSLTEIIDMDLFWLRH